MKTRYYHKDADLFHSFRQDVSDVKLTFSNVYDCNGRQICENDFVKVRFNGFDIMCIAILRERGSRSKIELRSWSRIEHLLNSATNYPKRVTSPLYEVIGNIFQNPTLINQVYK